MKFSDIKKFPFASYHVNIFWDYLEDYLAGLKEDYDLDINPPFQRGYVWTPRQKIDFVEYGLRGGFSGRDVFFNCLGWSRGGFRSNAVSGWQTENTGYFRFNDYRLIGNKVKSLLVKRMIFIRK